MSKPTMYCPFTFQPSRGGNGQHHKRFKSPPCDDDIVILGGYPGGLSHREEEIIEQIKVSTMKQSKRKQVKR